MSVHEEKRLSLGQTARLEEVDPATVFRWIRTGLLDRSGSRVYLEAFKRGGRLFTSVEALRRFYSRLTDPGTKSTHESLTRTGHEVAHREADRYGL